MTPTLETLETRATPGDLAGNPFYVPPVKPAPALILLDPIVDPIKLDWAAILTPPVVPSTGPAILTFTNPPPPPGVGP